MSSSSGKRTTTPTTPDTTAKTTDTTDTTDTNGGTVTNADGKEQHTDPMLMRPGAERQQAGQRIAVKAQAMVAKRHPDPDAPGNADRAGEEGAGQHSVAEQASIGTLDPRNEEDLVRQAGLTPAEKAEEAEKAKH